MAASPSGDPPDEAQAIDATCTIRLPDTTTVLVHDSTETVMWRRFTRVPPSTGTGSAKRSLQRSVAVRWKDGVIRRKVRFRDFEFFRRWRWEQSLRQPRVPTSGWSGVVKE